MPPKKSREDIEHLISSCLLNASTEVPIEQVEDAIYGVLNDAGVLTNTTEVVVNSKGAHVAPTTLGSFFVPLFEGQKIETPVQEFDPSDDLTDGAYWATMARRQEVFH